MPGRNPYRGLLIDVPRTGNNPEQMARAILPARQCGRALEVFGNHMRLISATNVLVHLEDNWYMLVLEGTAYYGFAPQSGVSRADFDRINVAARTSTIPVPWPDEEDKVKALNGDLPDRFRQLLY